MKGFHVGRRAVSSLRIRKTRYRIMHWLNRFGSYVCLSLIRAYQLIISPVLPPSCRFTPTCSQYAMDAIGRHGVGRGLYLAVKRVLRCHPFHPGGFDPVDN